MDTLTRVIGAVGNSIYGMQALCALFGGYCVVIVLARMKEKTFPNDAMAAEFLGEVSLAVKEQRLEAAVELCDSGSHWMRATPQLILLALQNRDKPLGKIKQLLADRFDRDVISDLENRVSWINTMVKTAPMLGLQGTVVGMIAAFGKIATMQKSGADPSVLATDISLALWTTAIGLLIAIPLIMAGNSIQIRLRRLQESVQQQLSVFLEECESVLGANRKRTS